MEAALLLGWVKSVGELIANVPAWVKGTGNKKELREDYLRFIEGAENYIQGGGSADVGAFHRLRAADPCRERRKLLGAVWEAMPEVDSLDYRELEIDWHSAPVKDAERTQQVDSRPASTG